MSLNTHVSPAWHTTLRESMTIPTGMAAENSSPGAPMLDEWNAGTIVMLVFLTFTAPPMLNPTLFTPQRSNHEDISTIDATTAPARLAIWTASPRWSP